MPYSVGCLCNVKKDSRAHASVFKRFYNYDFGDKMHLVSCRVMVFWSQTDAFAVDVSRQ
jgi:hypothetical protein